MKWSDLPLWLKVIIVLAGIITVFYLIKAAVDYVQSNKSVWYRKWLATQKEIRELQFEKQRLILLLKRAKRYSLVTLMTLKVVLLFIFAGFTYYLILVYDLNFFSALGASAATVATTYNITACVLNRKIRGLNELHDMVSVALERIYQKRLQVEPARLLTIDVKLELLRKEASLLKENLHS